MTIPFFLMGAIYRATAGLSDLRVDLPMAFLYGSAALWWLIARVDSRWKSVLITGLLVGLACLTRAIAPIYFLCGFLPLLIFDISQSTQRKQLLGKIFGVLVAASILSGWFYIYHFKFIKYYYTEWNTDANATMDILMESPSIASSLFLAGLIGYLDHTQKQEHTASGHRKIIQVLSDDAANSERDKVTYSVTLMSSVSSASLEGMFQYEWGGNYVNGNTVETGGIQFQVSHALQIPSEANWQTIPGESIDDQIDFLESRAAESVDYIVSPTFSSAEAIQAKYSYSYAARYAQEILQQFHQSGNWTAISEPIAVEDGISVVVLANKKKATWKLTHD